MSFLNQVTQGDCLELMPQLPDASVDMVLCDLPYGTTACKWDSVIPFASLWGQYRRVSKTNAAIVLTAAQPFTSALVMSNPRGFKYDWVWRKPKGTGQLNAKKQPMRDKEDVVVFCHGTAPYNPQMASGAPFGNKHGRKTNEQYGAHAAINYENTGTRYPKQVLEFSPERGTSHPTQKPVALFEYLIRTYTNPGDVVLDNCCGSGTTGVAARNTGRQFIQFELSPEYCEVARKRLAQQRLAA